MDYEDKRMRQHQRDTSSKADHLELTPKTISQQLLDQAVIVARKIQLLHQALSSPSRSECSR